MVREPLAGIWFEEVEGLLIRPHPVSFPANTTGFAVLDGTFWSLLSVSHENSGGRGGLVVRSRLWGLRVPDSKLDSTKDPPCMGPVAR
ncbi:hypothetical protein AVEN_100695-1 [Araneus ventricosus]|uniref:Uncharacterized protein n=1 Tax=Araneus ventricosus TaxID=182803 RepID=A0A4Y2CUF0_ARAVE|nr:hypothetical protein AVEN_100695-1 [Araneus ventricosus]